MKKNMTKISIYLTTNQMVGHRSLRLARSAQEDICLLAGVLGAAFNSTRCLSMAFFGIPSQQKRFDRQCGLESKTSTSSSSGTSASDE
jgi:hypothetical protein